MLETFTRLVAKSESIRIAFGDRNDPAKQIMDTTITITSQVDNLKEYIECSLKSDSCYHLDGTVTFYDWDSLAIDFGLDPTCPAFYFYIEGKPVTYKMSDRSERYLAGIRKSLLSNRTKTRK